MGSGIYSAGKPLGYYISEQNFVAPYDKHVIAKVPKTPGNVEEISDGKRLHLKDLKSRDTNLEYVPLDSNKGEVIAHVTSKVFWPLQCTLEYEFDYQDEKEKYALAASIFRDKKDTPLTYALCSLSLRPENKQEPQSNGYSVKSKFKYLKISWIYIPSYDITVMPTVLGHELRLLNPADFILENQSLSMKQNAEAVSILTANLWGKIAGKDDGYCSNYHVEDGYCEIGDDPACGG